MELILKPQLKTTILKTRMSAAKEGVNKQFFHDGLQKISNKKQGEAVVKL
jgi:hypothetical protein